MGQAISERLLNGGHPLTVWNRSTGNTHQLLELGAPDEAITIGRAGGLDDAELTDPPGDSPIVAPGIRNRFRTVLEASGPTWWTTELGAKDARLATELVTANAATQLHLAPVRDLYQAVADAGLSDDDVALISRLYR